MDTSTQTSTVREEEEKEGGGGIVGKTVFFTMTEGQKVNYSFCIMTNSYRTSLMDLMSPDELHWEHMRQTNTNQRSFQQH